MVCTVIREKIIRTNRRSRSMKPESEQSTSMADSGLKSLNYQLGFNESNQNSDAIALNNNNLRNNSNPNSFDVNGWGYCTEEQLEGILYKHLDFIYKEAISKLVAIGFDEDVALKAVLRNGHCYGGNDVLTNIVNNCLSYLNSSDTSLNVGFDGSEPIFSDLRQLEEYSLTGMVVLLQQVRPELSKGDAMWCLLMSDIHVGRASTMQVPMLPGHGNSYNPTTENLINAGPGSDSGIMTPGLCKFHEGWGFGNGGGPAFSANEVSFLGSNSTSQKEIELSNRFNLSPSLNSLLNRNVALFAAGFRANSTPTQMQLQAFPSNVADGEASTGASSAVEVPVHQEGRQGSNNQDVNLVLNKFRDLNLDENKEFVTDEKKEEMILTLLHQIKNIEEQVKERKEWAHQRAMQAARKLSNDLNELKLLRMEREETQRLKKGKQTLEDSTLRKLSEMENALRRASGQVDRSNAAVRRLETENAEIRAEIEASKLSASESVATCLEVAKREKKCLKRLLAWEKQKTKLQEEIGDEKKKLADLQLQVVNVERASKEAELNLKNAIKSKGLAIVELENALKLKEATEEANRKRLEVVRLKTEIDLQRQKDDIQRLEQELSRLRASTAYETKAVVHPLTAVPIANTVHLLSPQDETIARMLRELDDMEASLDKGVDRGKHDCVICMREDVSVVFLPCAHQVLCSNCNEGYQKSGMATCPSCRVPIEQRIRVFGVAS